MNYLKLVMSNKDGSFTIAEDEFNKLLEAVKNGSPAVFREGVLLNPNMCVSVVVDKERNRLALENKQAGSEYEQPSTFAKLLGKELPKLE